MEGLPEFINVEEKMLPDSGPAARRWKINTQERGKYC